MNLITNNQEKCQYALQNLYEVIDPEIGLNIVDLGLVYELNFDEPNKILQATMTLTTQFCPMGEAITTNARNALSASFSDWEINLTLSFEPPWNYTMISAAGNEFLGR